MTTDIYDLRHAFDALASAVMADGDEDEEDSDELDDDDDEASDPPDPAADADDTDDQDDSDDEDDKKKKRKDSHQRAHRQAAKYRVKLRQAERRIAELEAPAGRVKELEAQVRDLQLRTEFNDACHAAHISDRDAAWKLVTDDLKGVKITDGTVDTDRLGEIVAHVVKRYPYLINADEDKTSGEPGTAPSVKPAGRGKPNTKKLADDAIRKKYPALTGRG